MRSNLKACRTISMTSSQVKPQTTFRVSHSSQAIEVARSTVFSITVAPKVRPVVAYSLVAICLAAVPTIAHAALPSQNALDLISDKFLTASSAWAGVITGFAAWLFWVLATISLVWTFGVMALRKADLGEFFAEFTRFTITTGFYLWLLLNGPTFAIAIINSLRRVGAAAASSGGVPGVIAPSTPLNIAFNIIAKISLVTSGTINPATIFVNDLISVAILVAMCVVAANVLLALITSWIMAYAGIFVLGFGGSRWTSEMAISYFRHILAIGLELMTITLMIGVATSVAEATSDGADLTSFFDLLVVLAIFVVLALLIDKVPGRVAALAGGGSGAGHIGAGTVVGAAMGAAFAAAAAGRALGSAATGAMGWASAVSAATESVRGGPGGSGPRGEGDGGRSGLSDLLPSNVTKPATSFEAGMGDANVGTSTGQQLNDQTADGQGGASATAANASEFGAHAGTTSDGNGLAGSGDNPSTLGKHAGTLASAARAVGGFTLSTGKAVADSLTTAAKVGNALMSENVAQNTRGGRIATAIRARTAAAADAAKQNTAQFRSDSLSAGSEGGRPDLAAEIAAFVSRTPPGST